MQYGYEYGYPYQYQRYQGEIRLTGGSTPGYIYTFTFSYTADRKVSLRDIIREVKSYVESKLSDLERKSQAMFYSSYSIYVGVESYHSEEGYTDASGTIVIELRPSPGAFYIMVGET